MCAGVVCLIVINARIWTGDPGQPRAEALAVSGERIAAVGSNAEIGALRTESTRVIDGGGAMLTPGFIDAHIHLFAFDRSHPFPPIFLRYLRNREEVAARIRGYAAKLPKGAWILGEDWVDSLWGETLPSRDWLDRVAPEHPVWLTNAEGDAGIANSAALRAAGVESRGVIRGGAMWRMEAAQIAGSREPDRIVEKVIDDLIQAGVTSVHHNNGWHDFLILQRMRREGRLRLRVYATPPLPAWRRLRDYIAEYGRGDSQLHWGAVKGYGAIMAEREYPWVAGASQAGLQVMVHTGGAAEQRTLLDVFERVTREQGPGDRRFRMEHGHEMPPDVIARMARLGAIASWQPPLVAHAGLEKSLNLFPCRALLEAGVKIAFGTDAQAWTAGIVSPVDSLRMAMERAPITLDEALRAYTSDAAYAEFAEKEKGTLEAGKLADFVLFDGDLSRAARVRMTVIGGKVEYEVQK